MTTDSSAIVNTLTRKIEELERSTAALTAAISRSRKTRLWILLGVVLFLGVFLLMFWNLFSQLQSEEYQEKLMNQVQAKFLGSEMTQDEMNDLLMEEAGKLREPVQVALTNAFQGQIDKDMPAYTKLILSEREILVENLRTKLQSKLEEQQTIVRERHVAILKEEFPEVESDVTRERMLNNIDLIVKELVEEKLVKIIEQELQGLFETWEKFPPDPNPVDSDEDRADIAYAHLMDSLFTKLIGSPETETTTD
jgi:hypothetical protein